MYIQNFPLEEGYQKIVKDDISEYKDLIEVSDLFKTDFYNAGVMKNGCIYTVKVKPDCNKLTPLKSVRETDKVDDKFFLDDEKLKKFEYLKGGKKIPRIKPNGEPYTYSEGAIAFPDNLDSPARTMLTSESGISRTTHVIKDVENCILKFLVAKFLK